MKTMIELHEAGIAAANSEIEKIVKSTKNLREYQEQMVILQIKCARVLSTCAFNREVENPGVSADDHIAQISTDLKTDVAYFRERRESGDIQCIRKDETLHS